MEHLEGRLSVFAALQAGQRKFESILISKTTPDEKVREILETAKTKSVPVRRVEEAELEGIVHGHTHGGVVALCTAKPFLDAEAALKLVAGLKEPPLLLLLEGADDARNLGFTLRSAEAFGVHGVIIKKRVMDFDPVEVGRPSAGAFERLALIQVEDVALIETLKKRGLKLYGCLDNVSRTVYETQMWKPSIVAVGGEKRGLSGAVRSICDSFMKIPTRTGSLSLSHAAAVALGEAMRQRLSGGPKA